MWPPFCNYRLYQIGKSLYKDYCFRRSQIENFSPVTREALRAYYSQQGIDLARDDKQFAKYGLLSATSDFTIRNDKDQPTLFDTRFDQHLWIDVPNDLLAAIEDLRSRGLAGAVAFNVTRIDNELPLMEAAQFGATFSFAALELPAVSKFYDDANLENALWIQADRKSLTFEELCSDLVEWNDFVVTQVVHLELFEKEDRLFIGHIDHEYILYTYEAYCERTVNAKVKGHDKLKTFKIDGACIPLDHTFHNRYFLYLTIDAYLKNKVVLREYFSKILA